MKYRTLFIKRWWIFVCKWRKFASSSSWFVERLLIYTKFQWNSSRKPNENDILTSHTLHFSSNGQTDGLDRSPKTSFKTPRSKLQPGSLIGVLVSSKQHTNEIIRKQPVKKLFIVYLQVFNRWSQAIQSNDDQILIALCIVVNTYGSLRGWRMIEQLNFALDTCLLDSIIELWANIQCTITCISLSGLPWLVNVKIIFFLKVLLP